MASVNKYGEVADFTENVDQFAPGASVNLCGPYAVAYCAYMAAPGSGRVGTVANIQTWAKQSYERYVGPDVASDAGITYAYQLYQMLADATLPFFVRSNTLFSVAKAIGNFRPVIVTVPESSLFDVTTGKVDYSWDTTGINHIVTITGMRSDGALLVRDPANIISTGQRGPGPLVYDSNKIGPFYSVIEVIPPWQVPASGPSPDLAALRSALTPFAPFAKAILDILSK